MFRKFVLGTIVVAACGGEPDAVTAASARPHPEPMGTETAAVPVPSATQAPTATGTFTPAPSIATTSLPNVEAIDTPAIVARKYGGATVPVAARIKALQDLDAKWSKDFAPMPRAEREKAAAAWLAARPEIEASGVASTGVWARFKDGKLIVAPTYAWPSPTPHHAERETHHDRSNAKDIPQSKGRSTPDWFGYDTNTMIASWLDAHGYADAGSGLKVGPLRTQIKNAGVLYMNTHGAEGTERDMAQANATGERHWTDIYSLLTDTQVLDTNGNPITHNVTPRAQREDVHNNTPNDASQTEDDLAHGRLVYFYAPLGDDKAEWHYGITFRFVGKYFSFADDSFVFLNACSSQSKEAELMTSAFKAKNASFIAGWDHEVTPNTAMRAAEFMFDRLLGANKMTNYGLQADKPKQRPWNVASTFAELKGKSYDHETNGKGEACTLKYVGDTSVTLVPIIDKMEADDVKHVLTLHGTFGDDPADKDRHVKIGGSDCPVKEWGATEVTCDLGTDFKHGDVIADKQGRKSNPSPLTGWNVHLQYKVDMGITGQFGMGLGFEAHVRADVHKVRATPTDAPQARDPVTFYGAPDSKCGSTGDKGSYAANGGRAWMTSGTTIPIAQGPPTGGDICIIYGQADSQASKLKIMIMAVTRNGAGTFNVAAPGVNMSRGFGLAVIPNSAIFDGTIPPPAGLPPQAAMPTAIFLSLDDKGNIAAGKKGPANLGNSGKAKVTLEWDAAQAEDYPTDDTPQ